MDTKEIIAVMQAYLEGKTIEMFNGDDWVITTDPMWDWGAYEYRIKPEPKIRPYANEEEFLQACKEHGPFLKFITTRRYHAILIITDTCIKSSDDWYGFEHLTKYYTWQDDTPCGIQE